MDKYYGIPRTKVKLVDNRSDEHVCCIPVPRKANTHIPLRFVMSIVIALTLGIGKIVGYQRAIQVSAYISGESTREQT